MSLKSTLHQYNQVGRTVPSFSMAAEIERTKWKEFDQMYIILNHSAACSNASRPVVIHAVLMSIIFQHYEQLTKLMELKKPKDRAKFSTLDVWTQTEGR